MQQIRISKEDSGNLILYKRVLLSQKNIKILDMKDRASNCFPVTLIAGAGIITNIGRHLLSPLLFFCQNLFMSKYFICMCIWYPLRPEEGIRYLGTGARDS